VLIILRIAAILATGVTLFAVACGGEETPPQGTPTPFVIGTPIIDGIDEVPTPVPGLFVFGETDAQLARGDHVMGINPLVPWSALEPREGVYDWTTLDDAVAAATAADSKIAPRILTNANLFGQPTPEWFFEAEGARFYYPSLEAEERGYKAPVSWDPVFQAKFGRFLEALGERYNANPAIEFFQTNAGGGLYGEIVVTKDYARFPADWTPEAHSASIVFWLDRWLDAFPDTSLSLMVNHVGDDIGESAAAYAAGKGVYLQQNTPWLPEEAVAIFLTHEAETKIVLEAEDGCSSTDEEKFDHLIEAVFGYGFAIDYLHLCAESFWDEATAAKLPAIAQRLRR
jgi:hypothetical protein